MKNNYLKLKLSILLQTVLVTAITVLVGGFLLDYVVDGIYNDSFAKTFVSALMSMRVKEKTAIKLYWSLIGNNKTFFMIVGFLRIIFLCRIVEDDKIPGSGGRRYREYHI